MVKMSRAYLHIRLKIVRGIPRFRGIGMYSESATSVTTFGGEFYAEILYADGDSYEEAISNLNNTLESPWLAWAKELLGGYGEEVRRDEENPLNVALEHMGELP